MWGLVGNPEDRFSHNEAHIMINNVVVVVVVVVVFTRRLIVLALLLNEQFIHTP